MIRKFYIDADTGGGDAKDLMAPKDYTVTTPEQRTDWNTFLDYAATQKGANLSDPKGQTTLMANYKKDNPAFSITPDHIPGIQYEANQLRKGEQFGNMGSAALDYMRQGMQDNFLARDGSDLAKLHYPTTASHGTDIEGYYSSKMGLEPIGSAAPSPAAGVTKIPEKAPNLPLTAAATPAAGGATPGAPPKTNLIPRPNYNDQSSRNNFLKSWAKQYGDLQGRGDTILKLNEVPRGGHGTAEEIATNAAKKFGIDPALLHVSAFEEGASELFKDKSGLDTKHRKPTDFGYMGDYGDKEFPVNGSNSFGLPDFTKRFPDLVAAGLLPKSFQNQFRGTKKAGEFGENNFKSVEDAMTAKAALMKYGGDYVDKIANKNGVELSPKQKDFFMLAWFNGGEGAVLSRIPQYKTKGYLKDDSFLNKRPKEEMGKPDNLDVYGHVVPRIKRRDALVEQQFFQSKSN